MQSKTKNFIIRLATIDDLKYICRFGDFWLAGRGKRLNAPGAVDDCFISPSQHKRYIEKYKTYLLISDTMLVGWAVVQTDGSLIHFLISGFRRNEGFGSKLLEHIKPKKIHSKLDQSSGNPGPFYEKHGYHKTSTKKSHSRLDINRIKPNRKKNIDIYELLL